MAIVHKTFGKKLKEWRIRWHSFKAVKVSDLVDLEVLFLIKIEVVIKKIRKLLFFNWTIKKKAF